jgi:hypothetical protein
VVEVALPILIVEVVVDVVVVVVVSLLGAAKKW